MRVGLIDIDSKMPNLALMKISKYYKEHKAKAELTSPLFADQYDFIWASKIFTYTELPIFKCNAIGGSGVDLKTTLPEYIEDRFPDYNLYPNMDYSLGFTTRGCIRKCLFCVVPEKEGKIKAVNDIYGIWNDKHKTIKLLDNNILALPDHFEKIAKQIIKEKLIVDFNQGLDHRLLNDDNISLLKQMRHIHYRFSFDNINQEKTVLKSIKLLNKHKINFSTWYVLVGFDSTFEQDLYRLNLLKKENQRAYVQIYDFKDDPQLKQLARWGNQRHLFANMTWEDFLNHPDNNFALRYFQ